MRRIITMLLFFMTFSILINETQADEKAIANIKEFVRIEAKINNCDPNEYETIMLDWHKSFKLSSNSLSSVMRRVRVDNSKLKGNQVLQVLKASRPAIFNLYKSGNLELTAVWNIVDINIAAAKN